MAIFSTITEALGKGAGAAGISLSSIAAGFGLINNQQRATNYDTPLNKSTDIDLSNIQQQIDEKKRRIQNNKDDLRYPPDIDQRFMKFVFYEYARPTVLGTPTRNQREVIVLPVPAHNIAEKYDPIIEGRSLGLAGQLLDAGTDVFRNGPNPEGTGEEALAGAVTGLGIAAQQYLLATIDRRIKQGVASKAEEIGRSLSGAVALGAETVAQSVGLAINPHPTFFFKGMKIRNHNFKWNFAPRNKDESEKLNTIIKTFKKNMLPQYEMGGVFLKYPSMCQISFHPETEYNPEMKLCFVDSMSATYSPQTFANSNAPAFTNLAISFQEIEMVVHKE